AVDDQIFRRRLGQRAVPAVAVRAEIETVGGEEQHRAGNRRLRDRGLVEVLQLLHLRARQRALEGLVVALDLGDELGDVIVGRDARRGDLLAVAVETADEPHLGHQVLSAVISEIKDAVLLADLRRLHWTLLRFPPPRRAYRREYKGKLPFESKWLGRLGGAAGKRERLQHLGAATVLHESGDAGGIGLALGEQAQ